MAGARLINDDDPICRKLCAKCIKEMVSRMPANERNKLFDIVLNWLIDKKVITGYYDLKQAFYLRSVLTRGNKFSFLIKI